jgi:hypothetical protein
MRTGTFLEEIMMLAGLAVGRLSAHATLCNSTYTLDVIVNYATTMAEVDRRQERFEPFLGPGFRYLDWDKLR